MRIDFLLVSEETELHIWSRHRVTPREAEEACFGWPYTRRGRENGLYEVAGRTEAGRYLIVVVRYHGKGVAAAITVRDMSERERRWYRRTRLH